MWSYSAYTPWISFIASSAAGYYTQIFYLQVKSTEYNRSDLQRKKEVEEEAAKRVPILPFLCRNEALIFGRTILMTINFIYVFLLIASSISNMRKEKNYCFMLACDIWWVCIAVSDGYGGSNASKAYMGIIYA